MNLSDKAVGNLIRLSKWDFRLDLSINIVGHIFEQSISDLEKEKAKIENQDYEPKKEMEFFILPKLSPVILWSKQSALGFQKREKTYNFIQSQMKK